MSENRREFLLRLGGTFPSRPSEVDERGVSPSAPLTATQITPTPAFHIQSINPYLTPRRTWELTIDGLVAPASLIVAKKTLLSLPTVHTTRTIECIGNPSGGHLIGNAVWEGVRLRDALDGLAIQAEATHANLIGGDGYQTAVRLDQLLHEDTLLAHHMNGQPLSHDHGAPFRLLIPAVYGLKMVKWLARIQFTSQPLTGYWEKRGWPADGEVYPHAGILTPTDGATLGGPVAIQGYAFAGQHAIERVEVRIDNGEWVPADLLRSENPLAWSLWQLRWPPHQRGSVSLEARAIDAAGRTQAPRPDQSHFFQSTDKSGARPIHRIHVEVV